MKKFSGREEACYKRELQKFHTLHKNIHILNNPSAGNSDNKLKKNQEANPPQHYSRKHVPQEKKDT